MGLPLTSPSLAFALIVFVLTPEGEVATIGGDALTEGDTMALPEAGVPLASALRRHMDAALPRGTITSRLRPLMPRVGRAGRIVMPLWATGRMPDRAFFQSHRAGRGPDALDALGRLARTLNDLTLVDEARAEFRRALASDPASHQLLSEQVRRRVLAVDELEVSRLRERGVPPLFGLLPETFTIDELQRALQHAARLDDRDTQRASNFRRRLVEFHDSGVLERASETEPVRERDGRGRRPQYFRFNFERWLAWLSEASLERHGHDHLTVFQRRASNDRWLTDELAAEPSGAVQASLGPRVPGGDADRLEALEHMLHHLASEIARLKTPDDTTD